MCDIAFEFASNNSRPAFSAIALLDYLMEKAEKLNITEWESVKLNKVLLNTLLSDAERLSKVMKNASEAEVFDAMLRARGLLPPTQDARDE